MAVDPRLQAALDMPHGAARDILKQIKPKKGYAAPIGSGPADETCHSCLNIGGVKGNEYASQCRIAKRGHFGVAIFISPKSPACSRWQPQAHFTKHGTGESWGA